MLIKNVHIENYRSLKEVDITCDELTAIIGRNGAGKSTILHALSAFYNLSKHFTEYDYFGKDTDLEIKIRVTFHQLRDDEKVEFGSYLKEDELTVTKVINISGGAKYHGVTKQIPQFHDIRELSGANDKKRNYNDLVKSERFNGLGPTVTKAEDIEPTLLLYEESHPELTAEYDSPQQFLGPSNVGGGKLDKYTKFVIVPAVRDASSELDKKGAILQLVDILVARSVDSRKDVRELNEEFQKKVKEVYNTENIQELAQLGEMITELLEQYSPGASLLLSFSDAVPPEIKLPPAEAALVEDKFSGPISHTGHGLQRALILALLQQLTITVPQPISEDDGQGIEEEQQPPDLIIAIEEPELYLHPSRSRYLSDVLLELSGAEDHELTTQVLYGTHSPYFIGLDRFDKIRLAKKIHNGDYDLYETTVTQYSREEAAQRLAEISGGNPAEFTGDGFAARAATVMNPIVNEGFFADVVLVVEGLSDAAALGEVQKQLKKNWDALGIVIVPADGKNNIDRPVAVFTGLGIPTYFLFDGDSSCSDRDKTKTIECNVKLQRLAGVDPEDFPETQANETWAVFSDKLETEIKIDDDDKFNEFRQAIADELGYTRSSTILKNPEAVARYVRHIYKEGYRLETVENIVEKVTALLGP